MTEHANEGFALIFVLDTATGAVRPSRLGSALGPMPAAAPPARAEALVRTPAFAAAVAACRGALGRDLEPGPGPLGCARLPGTR